MRSRIARSTLPGIGLRELGQAIDGPVVEGVDLVVADGDLAGGGRVGVGQGPHRLGEELGRQAPHLGQADVAVERRLGRELAGLLGDVRDRVADPLQLVADPVERQQEAQVAGDRRLGRDRQDDVVHRLDLERVDLLVAADDEERLLRVVRHEGLDREADPLLDDAAHPQEDVLDRALLAVERLPRERHDGLGDLALDGPEDLLDLAVEGRLRAGGSRSVIPASCPLSRSARTRSPRSSGSSGW